MHPPRLGPKHRYAETSIPSSVQSNNSEMALRDQTQQSIQRYREMPASRHTVARVLLFLPSWHLTDLTHNHVLYLEILSLPWPYHIFLLRLNSPVTITVIQLLFKTSDSLYESGTKTFGFHLCWVTCLEIRQIISHTAQKYMLGTATAIYSPWNFKGQPHFT